MAAMPAGIRARVVQNATILAKAAVELGIPFLVTRQYPKGLGETVPPLPDEAEAIIDKTAFSCVRAKTFPHLLKQTKRSQVILAGVETHVCILQSAFDLRASGYQVCVVEDGVCSRTKENHRNAIRRMEQEAIQVTCLESVLFEWLADARHPSFKTVSQLIK